MVAKTAVWEERADRTDVTCVTTSCNSRQQYIARHLGLSCIPQTYSYRFYLKGGCVRKHHQWLLSKQLANEGCGIVRSPRLATWIQGGVFFERGTVGPPATPGVQPYVILVIVRVPSSDRTVLQKSLLNCRKSTGGSVWQLAQDAKRGNEPLQVSESNSFCHWCPLFF